LPTMLKDPGLAPEGRRKIDFAASRMPVLSAVADELARTRPLAGHRIAACLHVTTETANLCRALVAGGAELALCASNPLSTKDDVAAAIHDELGAAVFAVHGADRDTFYRQVEGVLATRPTLVVDDGADLTATIHTSRRDLLAGIAGGTEVTSTGVLRARNMARDGALAYPLLAVNDADTKHLFDNRHGTGQSTLDGILRATNVLLAGKVLVVVGYGWCGRGLATRARGMGSRVVVCEVDPLRALEAVMEGYQVLPVAEAARVGEVFVTVTGNRDAITLEHLLAMPDGAIVANAGHFDLEIDLAGLRQAATAATEVRPGAVAYQRPSGGRVVVLAEGRLVGQVCAEAHPAEVMDLTFATQALAVERLATATDPSRRASTRYRPRSRSGSPARSWPPSGSAATTSPPPRRSISRPGTSAPDQAVPQAASSPLRSGHKDQTSQPSAGAVHADRGTGGRPEPDRDGAT
jgi:adenosylhomocysteinase